MNNPFEKIFTSFFGAKDTSVIGIDIGSSAAKIVQLKKKGGRAILETYGEIALGPYNNTEIGRSAILGIDRLSEVVKDLLRESNSTTKRSAISIPIGSSLIKFIELPQMGGKQLSEMIPLEARKYIPVPISEVTIDYWVIPKNDNIVSEFENGEKINTENSHSNEVLLVVIHNEALERNRQIAQLVGLENSFSEIELFSGMRSVMDPSILPQMIIDIGAGSTKVYIVERGILRSSHIINRGSQDITLAISKSMGISFDEAEKIKRQNGIVSSKDNANLIEISSLTVDYIFSEIGRIVLSYEKKYGKKISKIFLTGGGVLLKGLKEKAEISFKTPVVVADPFSKVEYPAFLDNVLKSAGPEFAVALGLALRKLQEI
ncbi:MAG: type IV pilus assembly protein PilM [Minisyncoccia bacterium]